MNCKHFEAIIDGYLDGVLEPREHSAAWDHVSSCGACDAVVTSYQQASALLKAAVTDKVAAVDVSGLWMAIESEISAIDAVPGHASDAGWMASPAVRLASASRGARRLLARLRDWGQRAGTFGSALPLGPVRVAAALVVAVTIGSVLWSGTADQSSPERVARVKSKAVRIEALEVPSGYTVSTWARPRSRTRMIAINPTPGYAVASAAFSSR